MSLRWPEPWQWPTRDGADGVNWIELLGPDDRSGFVTARLAAEQAELLPAQPDANPFFVIACTHLVARDVRRSYETGLPSSDYVSRDYQVPAALEEVIARLDAGVELPELGEFDDKINLGTIVVDDTFSHWPLTFFDLVGESDGTSTLILEVDAEHGPILTFFTSFSRHDLDSRNLTPCLSTADPFWRAAASVAIDWITIGLDNGTIVAPVGGHYFETTVDLAAATQISSSKRALAELIDNNPTEWPA